ncbi:hypothetical protein [Phenylobacterium sp.]|uniref:hypothetical protein n=1 Tax=Phenylobacterium sp. TaxID=1871053 RepID=UPI002DE8878B|nr:hypothetical protein [Phenylobacterium sp.]
MAARLKVFVTSDGLTDYVVAASSRPKALAAWGSRQDLFKTGLAHETDDLELVKAATARPGEVLRRPAGARPSLAKLTPAKRTKPAGPSKAALKKVADLETKLAGLDADQADALAQIDQARAALDRKARSLTSRFAADRRRLAQALAAAKRARG